MENPFTELAQDNATALAHRYQVANELAIANYRLLTANWERNVGRNPAGDGEKPGPPWIYSVDQKLAASIFTAWNDDTAGRSGEGLPAPPGQEEPDYTPAITRVRFAVEQKPGPVVVPQPASPLGVKIGKGKFAPAPGDVLPVDSTWTDPITDVDWIKETDDTPFGPVIFWHVSA